MNMAGVTYAVVLQRLLLYSTHQVWHGFVPLLLQHPSPSTTHHHPKTKTKTKQKQNQKRKKKKKFHKKLRKNL
jgi:hypothetical protein